MPKYAFVGDVFYIDKHMPGAFIAKSKEISENQLYSYGQKIVGDFEKDHAIVAGIVPIKYHSEDDLKYFNDIISKTHSTISLLEDINMSANSYIFVNPSLAFGLHVGEKVNVGIACPAYGLAQQFAQIAKNGSGAILFSPVGKKMLGAVAYDPREYGQLELQIGPVPYAGKVPENDNLILRLPASVFENAEKEKAWIREMNRIIEDQYGSMVISYPVPE